jgi:TRAP-type mannitol/chloroaromatic compound transport system permease small subunit
MLARLWTGGVDGLGALGTLMIVALMTMICADVVARNVFGGSLPLVSELGAVTLVMIVYLQLGTTIRNDRLARTDLFVAALAKRRPAVAAVVSGLWDVVGAAVCAGIAYSTFGILGRAIQHRDFIGVTGVMTLPTWPFQALILLGLAVAAVQFILQAVRSFRTIAGASGPQS